MPEVVPVLVESDGTYNKYSFQLSPGDYTKAATNPYPHVVVYLQDGTIERSWTDSSGGVKRVTQFVTAGIPYLRQPSEEHSVTNIGMLSLDCEKDERIYLFASKDDGSLSYA